jgi:hypothetical protein
MARQRAKVAWLNEGDANTTFFHQHASYRRQKCVVRSLQVDSAVVSDHAAMAEASFSHLKALDAPRHLMDREFSLDLDFLGFGTEDLSNLELAFFEEEVWEVVQQLPHGKVLGSNEFTSEFL